MPLERVEDKTFGVHDTVVLDGKLFVKCVFQGCEVVYGGGEMAHEGCLFSNCRVTFVGAAHATVQLMLNFGYKIISPSGENPETKFSH